MIRLKRNFTYFLSYMPPITQIKTPSQRELLLQ